MRHLLALVLVAFCATACLTPRTRPTTLFEPAQLAWPDVSSDYEAGIVSGINEGNLLPLDADALRAHVPRMEEALTEKSVDKLRLVPWPTMKPWCDTGIDARLANGDIGQGVAASAREHVANFDRIMQRLRSPTQ